MGEGGQKVQTSSYEINKSWGYKVQQSDYSLNYLGNFPGGAVVKNPPANAGDTGSSPGLGRSHMPRSN